MNWKIICQGCPNENRNFELELLWLKEWMEENINYHSTPDVIRYKKFEWFKRNKYAAHF